MGASPWRSGARRSQHDDVGVDPADKDRTWTDGVVTIPRQQRDDLEAHLAGVDEEQMRWLWESPVTVSATWG